MPSRSSRPIAGSAIAVALLACGLVGGCSSGSSTGAAPPPAQTVLKSAEAATLPASGTTGPTLATPSPGASSTGSPVNVLPDFVDATFMRPRGFIKAPQRTYAPVVPLEESYISHYLLPAAAPHGSDLVSVIVYALPPEDRQHSSSRQSRQIIAFNSALDATVQGAGIQAAQVAGITGFEEDVTQPPNFHYSTWFAFGREHLLQLSCQYGTKANRALISRGCRTVLATLRTTS